MYTRRLRVVLKGPTCKNFGWKHSELSTGSLDCQLHICFEYKKHQVANSHILHLFKTWNCRAALVHVFAACHVKWTHSPVHQFKVDQQRAASLQVLKMSEIQFDTFGKSLNRLTFEFYWSYLPQFNLIYLNFNCFLWEWFKLFCTRDQITDVTSL